MITVTYAQGYGIIGTLCGFLLLQGALIGYQKGEYRKLGVLALVSVIGGILWPILLIVLFVGNLNWEKKS